MGWGGTLKTLFLQPLATGRCGGSSCYQEHNYLQHRMFSPHLLGYFFKKLGHPVQFLNDFLRKQNSQPRAGMVLAETQNHCTTWLDVFEVAEGPRKSQHCSFYVYLYLQRECHKNHVPRGKRQLRGITKKTKTALFGFEEHYKKTALLGFEEHYDLEGTLGRNCSL